jgi:ABC-type cobalamin/Fe3+-siderophores transport system ATPase subunit
MHSGAVVLSGPPSEVVTSDRLSSLYDIPVRVARLPPSGDGASEQLVCLPDVSAPRQRRLAANPPATSPPS